MEVRVLGSPDVVGDDGSVLVLAAKQRRLLAALAADPSKTRTVDALIQALWPERPPGAAAKALQVYVSRLRKELPRGIRIRTDTSGYTLELERDALDTARFERLLAEARIAFAEENASLAVSLLGRALSLWRGPAFGELAYEDFVRAEAERLEELRLLALEQQSEAQLRLGRHAAVLGNLRELAVGHPQRERMQAHLMLALYRCGRQTEALEVYTSLRDRLREELGLEPADELHELQRRILQHDPTLAPAPTVSEQTQAALPTPPNSLLGRRRELTELHRLLLDERVRLLVLTGAGGSGKTRLALEAAARTADAFANGACFVELAPLRNTEHIVGAIAHALALEAVPGADPLGTVADALGSRELLLILDNAEHLAAAAPLYTRLLARAPRLTLLVTSRTVLHVSGEHVYPVEPLSPPDAITLFNERAAEADSRFHPTSEDDQVIRQICRRLDGLPLALELAASRTRTLTPRELLDRLEPRIPLLTGGPRDLPARQQTLRATLDWSYDLLDGHERRDLCRLAVFAGGCTLEAAEAVCEASADTLQSLIDKSIIRRESARFTMLATIRDYAIEQLDRFPKHAHAVRTAHAAFVLRWVKEAEPAIARSDVLTALARDVANLRAALAWLADHDPDSMLELVGSAWRFWHQRGEFDEGRQWLEQALARTEGPPLNRAHALRGLAAMLVVPDERERSKELLIQALSIYQREGEKDGIARCLNNLGLNARLQENFDEAATLYESALALSRELAEEGHGPGTAIVIGNLADLALEQGDLTKARELVEEHLRTARAEDNDVQVAEAHGFIAWLEVLSGRYEDAAPHLRSALEYARIVGGQHAGGAFIAAAASAAHRGNSAAAARLLGAEEVARKIEGLPRWDKTWTGGRVALRLQRQLDESGYAAERATGRDLSFTDAIDLALTVIG